MRVTASIVGFFCMVYPMDIEDVSSTQDYPEADLTHFGEDDDPESLMGDKVDHEFEDAH